jgi:hypothetical protein
MAAIEKRKIACICLESKPDSSIVQTSYYTDWAIQTATNYSWRRNKLTGIVYDKDDEYDYVQLFTDIITSYWTEEASYVSMTIQPFVGPWPLFNFLISLDRGSARRKASTYTKNIKAEQTHTDIHDSNGIRIHDSCVSAGLRPSGHCDRQRKYPSLTYTSHHLTNIGWLKEIERLLPNDLPLMVQECYEQQRGKF